MGRKRSESNTGPRPARAFRQPRKLTLEVVKQQLTQAASNAFVAGHPTEYEQVNVVLLHFDNDDMGVDRPEDELAAVFDKEYGFDIERVLLPSAASSGALIPENVAGSVTSKLQAKGALSERCLVILVFSGHGTIMNETLEVRGHYKNGQFTRQSMTWLAAWAALFKFPCSVLQILDCCHAAEGSHPSVETLAATSATERTSSDMTACLTQAVARQLQAMDAGTSFSVSEFTAAMMADRVALKLDYFPSYASRHNKHSIVLNKKVGLPLEPEVFHKVKTKSALVLISVHVEDTLTHKDLNDLKQYLLTAIPHAIGGLEIGLEGWHTSYDSELLTFTLPAAVWLQLPEDEAWNFAHIVSS